MRQAQVALAALEAAAGGEPASEPGKIRRVASADFQGRTWATRKNLWVDRMASAWLIRRFIDRKAKFLWLDNPKKCPKTALGFDFDGATFTHVDGRVTFEVLAASFGLDGDPALREALAPSCIASTSAACRWPRRQASKRCWRDCAPQPATTTNC
jgi:hypothetical protein